MAQKGEERVNIYNSIFSYEEQDGKLKETTQYHSIDDYISLSKFNQQIKLFSYALKLCFTSYKDDSTQTGELSNIKNKICEYCKTSNIDDSIRDSITALLVEVKKGYKHHSKDWDGKYVKIKSWHLSDSIILMMQGLYANNMRRDIMERSTGCILLNNKAVAISQKNVMDFRTIKYHFRYTLFQTNNRR